MKKELVLELASHLNSAFIRIQSPSWEPPHLSAEKIAECFQNFMKSRGRHEWEKEAIVKTIIGCACPVVFVESSGIENMKTEHQVRVLCDKCKPYYGDQDDRSKE